MLGIIQEWFMLLCGGRGGVTRRVGGENSQDLRLLVGLVVYLTVTPRTIANCVYTCVQCWSVTVWCVPR